MKTSNVDLNMKWNDYSSDTLYLWDGETIFMISEGTGDNLWDEDVDAGYLDYWMTESYSFNEDTCDGGQWMETKLIRDMDYTIQGVIDRLMECDLWDSNWEILDDDTGYDLFSAYENYYQHRNEMRYYKEQINKLTSSFKKGGD